MKLPKKAAYIPLQHQENYNLPIQRNKNPSYTVASKLGTAEKLVQIPCGKIFPPQTNQDKFHPAQAMKTSDAENRATKHSPS